MIGNSNDAMAIRPMKSKSEDKFYLETYHSHDTSAEQILPMKSGPFHSK